MPKLGMEPIRRDALVKAAIAEIGTLGTLDVTVNQIAKRAGMSSGLAHHYFGSKDQMLLAAMRHILNLYGAEVRGAMSMANTPSERIEAIVRASFSSSNFRPDIVAAWLNFYVHAHKSKEVRRLLGIYQRRLHSNLMASLRSMVDDPEPVAETIGALIDGVYIRQALRQRPMRAEDAINLILDTVHQCMKEQK